MSNELSDGRRLLRWACVLAGLLVASVAIHAQPATAANSSPAPQSSPALASSGPLDSVRSWLRGPSSSPELLPPEQAFQLAVQARDADTLIAQLTPAKGYYLYRDRISFSVQEPSGITVASVRFPKGKPKADPTFGTVEVFHNPFEVLIRLQRSGDPADHLTLRTSYQGCNEPLGVCYAPIEKTVNVALSNAVASGSPSQAAQETPGGASESFALPRGDPSGDGGFCRLFTDGRTWALVAGFFGFGLLLAFTPCMLPMIPILSGIIVGQGHAIDPLPHDAPGHRRLFKGVGVIGLVGGVALLFGPPGIVFFDAQGTALADRVIGLEPPRQFLAWLERVLAPTVP